ncbi:MAG: YegS/Rv2252/BmrU family lipid kinase [Lactobacillaceae bacterium]|jgi:YegS/Rv2252/BmrU family lipid kinase|nr:YegS/Rv2252/BmrU family lipid kinase [Lactobacillaceae bacterium]
MTHHYTFLINPQARSGKSQGVWTKIQAFLVQHDINFTAKISKSAGDISNWAGQFSQQPLSATEHIVVIGGDGSLNEALNGILTKDPTAQIPLAYIPAGSGNDFARAHGLPKDPIESLKVILRDTTTRSPATLDIGKFFVHTTGKSNFFLNNVGVGFDAATVANTNNSHTKKTFNRMGIGKLSYFSSVFKTLANQSSFSVQVTADGETTTLDQAYLLTLSNHPYFGGGINIMPDADPNDQKLDLIIIEHKKHITRLLYILEEVMRGHDHYRLPEVHRFTAEEIRITTTHAEFAHADGEELGSHIYDITFTTQTYPFWV